MGAPAVRVSARVPARDPHGREPATPRRIVLVWALRKQATRRLASSEQIGNFPEAFSHLSLISAAINLDYQLDRGTGQVDQVLAAAR